MKAIAFDEFGGPEVLHEADMPVPEPGPQQARIRVHVSGVNPMDFKVRSGQMRPNLPASLPAIPGIEAAGVIDALGSDVVGFAVGDEVFGWTKGGSYAEYAIATTFAAKPAALSWEQAVALPVAGETAERVLRQLGLGAGETLLIHGASGAVGTVAVQLAVARGATVIGTASEANAEYLESLGAIPTGYGPGLVERVRELAPKGVDAVFDVAGKGALPDSITLRGGTSRIVTIADYAGAEQYGVTFSGGGPDSPRSPEFLASLAELAVQGGLVTAVSATFPLARAVDAHRASEAGHGQGKLVLTVD
ncbi:NADP-dependent oxidoreductase [Actinospica durhamensis]|uniref:NADP-dependent oxidoreductase n=1 Tax=Actinospica durhamensis TaxID=1508375 RepID=A0A941EW45_9ACTN|nr:NADP-dependent oxidoreductase [Actinospica durhamensis]MBR7838351.1 NADP-dependent oxidoreductase [Actinospica durhamensis]